MYTFYKKNNCDFKALYLIQRKFVILKDTKRNNDIKGYVCMLLTRVSVVSIQIQIQVLARWHKKLMITLCPHQCLYEVESLFLLTMVSSNWIHTWTNKSLNVREIISLTLPPFLIILCIFMNEKVLYHKKDGKIIQGQHHKFLQVNNK